MAITDQTILSEIQRVTLENVGDGGVLWPSGMWTATEVLGYCNRRQHRWMAETCLLWKVAEVATTLGQNAQAQPTDWIATMLLVYKNAAGVYIELPQSDVFAFDATLPTWPGATTGAMPTGYYEVEGDTLTAYLVPAPTEVGSALERYYVALGATLTGAGVAFAVPDEAVATIKYGVLADMLSKVGPAANPLLAAACEERWAEGVAMAQVMATDGWLAG